MPTTPTPDPIAALAAAVQTAETALASAEDVLRAATLLVEQDQATRYQRLSHQALAVRLAAAERTIARLTSQKPAPTPAPVRAAPGAAEREYDVQTLDDGRWRFCAVSSADRTSAAGIVSALTYARESGADEGWQYRAVARDLPGWMPLTDAELDALVLAEPAGD